jgi:hypothetical protein
MVQQIHFRQPKHGFNQEITSQTCRRRGTLFALDIPPPHLLVSQEFCFGVPACGFCLNQPAACGECRSQKAIVLKFCWKMMSKAVFPSSNNKKLHWASARYLYSLYFPLRNLLSSELSAILKREFQTIFPPIFLLSDFSVLQLDKLYKGDLISCEPFKR